MGKILYGLFQIVCEEEQDFCQKYICECDKAVIMALAEETKESGCPDGNPGCPNKNNIY